MIDIEKLCRKAQSTDAWEDNEAAYYALGCLKPHYPMPAIIYDVAYQIGDGDYWCGVYNRHLEEHNPMHDDCFVMLWNVHDDNEYKRKHHAHLYGVLG